MNQHRQLVQYSRQSARVRDSNYSALVVLAYNVWSEDAGPSIKFAVLLIAEKRYDKFMKSHPRIGPYPVRVSSY